MNAIKYSQGPARIAAPVIDAAPSASARTAIDFDYLADAARTEGGYNPAPKAPTSTGCGLHQ